MPRKREPYIAVELEAIEQVPAVAALAGRPEAEVGWGLIRLWRHAWRLRVSVLPTRVVEAFLPGCAEALTAFGFVEVTGEVATLRGMDRYLRVKEAQARAATETNTKRSESGAVSAPVSDLFSPEKEQERYESGAVSAPEERTANSEQRRAKTSSRQPSVWERLFRQMQEERAERLRSLRLDDAPQQLKAARVNQLLSGASRAMFGLLDDDDGATPEERTHDLLGLWKRYLWSAYWRGRDPAYPLEGFCARATLEKCVALWGSDADPLNRQEEWS